MTLAAHVYANGLFEFHMNFDEDMRDMHLKSADGGRAMRSEMVTGRTWTAWPRGIWIGWPVVG